MVSAREGRSGVPHSPPHWDPAAADHSMARKLGSQEGSSDGGFYNGILLGSRRKVKE